MSNAGREGAELAGVCVGVPAALATCWWPGEEEAWTQSRRQSGLQRRLWAQERLPLHQAGTRRVGTCFLDPNQGQGDIKGTEPKEKQTRSHLGTG